MRLAVPRLLHLRFPNQESAEYAVITPAVSISVLNATAVSCTQHRTRLNILVQGTSMRKLYALLTAALFAISMSASIAFEQKIDAPKPAATAKAATATPIAKAEAAKPVETKAAEPIDINTADEKSLMTLKGIGEVTAAKI
ncbi:MAG: hypothetical protein WCL29_04850, partial [Pseudomonadota bacterium]